MALEFKYTVQFELVGNATDEATVTSDPDFKYAGQDVGASTQVSHFSAEWHMAFFPPFIMQNDNNSVPILVARIIKFRMQTGCASDPKVHRRDTNPG